MIKLKKIKITIDNLLNFIIGFIVLLIIIYIFTFITPYIFNNNITNHTTLAICYTHTFGCKSV